jgi:phage FluMu protein Com
VSRPSWSPQLPRAAPRANEPKPQTRPARPGDIEVQCLRCRHVGRVTALDLSRRAINPNAPIASFVKRLRCRRCGSQSVRAKRVARNAG